MFNSTLRRLGYLAQTDHLFCTQRTYNDHLWLSTVGYLFFLRLPESADTDYNIFSNVTLLMLVSGARDSKECTKPVIIRPICVVLHPTPDVISCAISTLISSCAYSHGQQNAMDSKCAQWQAPEIQFLCATSAVSASCSTCPVTQREGVYAVPN